MGYLLFIYLFTSNNIVNATATIEPYLAGWDQLHGTDNKVNKLKKFRMKDSSMKSKTLRILHELLFPKWRISSLPSSPSSLPS